MKAVKKICGLTVNNMQVNFNLEMTETEVKAEVKKYRSFYTNRKDNKGIKPKITLLYR